MAGKFLCFFVQLSGGPQLLVLPWTAQQGTSIVQLAKLDKSNRADKYSFQVVPQKMCRLLKEGN
jgi:hypothetical protein